MSTLALCNVTKVFDQAGQPCPVLNGLSTQFHQGVSYGITGISGSGKSTLLFIMSGLEKPSSGQVLLDSRSLESVIASGYRDFFHRRIGMVFQSAWLVPELTVLENVMLKGLRAGQLVHECVKRGNDLLQKVGLEHKASLFPAQLSGGEQQRVAIIRALFLDPDFLLADEPTAHLDDVNKSLIMDLLGDYQKRLSMGLIISCHDSRVAERMDIQYALQDGRLVVQGSKSPEA